MSQVFDFGRSSGRFFSNVFVSCFLLPALLAATVIAVAVTATACAGESDPVTPPETVPPGQVKDTLHICISAHYTIKTLDVFVYRDKPTKPLETHVRVAGSEVTRSVVTGSEMTRSEMTRSEVPGVVSAKGDRIVAAVANSSAEFNLEALRSFDSIELLCMDYRDEDPSAPVMSGVLASDSDTLDLPLTPLLCPILLVSVENSLDALAEDVSISLRQVNSRAEIFRSDGFRPTETVDTPQETAHPEMMKARLPCDVGCYVQYPGLTLYGYPNDCQAVLGIPQTELVLDCSVGGERHSTVVPVHPLRRGETVPVQLRIE